MIDIIKSISEAKQRKQRDLSKSNSHPQHDNSMSFDMLFWTTENHAHVTMHGILLDVYEKTEADQNI